MDDPITPWQTPREFDLKDDVAKKLDTFVPGIKSTFSKDKRAQQVWDFLWSPFFPSITPNFWFTRRATNEYKNLPDAERNRVKKRLVIEIVILLAVFFAGVFVLPFYLHSIGYIIPK